MASLDKSDDRIASVQVNAELRQAQLDILSAQCATDRLRLRFSVDEVARHAQRHVLQKAWSSASALFDYYNTVLNRAQDREPASFATFDEAKVRDASTRVARYLHEQREHFWSVGQPLEKNHQDAMAPFFSSPLLRRARLVVLDYPRVPNPSFYAEARAMGFENLPDLAHMPSLTFEDVVVFQDQLTSRRLFHALVHVVQVEVLGLNSYAERFVRGFLRTRSHAKVPLVSHAGMLEAGFAEEQV